jgi:hypothetical protein
LESGPSPGLILQQVLLSLQGSAESLEHFRPIENVVHAVQVVSKQDRVRPLPELPDPQTNGRARGRPLSLEGGHEVASGVEEEEDGRASQEFTLQASVRDRLRHGLQAMEPTQREADPLVREAAFDTGE